MPDGWRLYDDWQVCDRCQRLTVDGRDFELLDRIVTMVEVQSPYDIDSDRERCEQAQKLAHWLNQRTTCVRIEN